MADIRIKDLPESASLEAGDYVAVDNSSDGTRRLSVGNLISGIQLVASDDGNGTVEFSITAITTV